MTSRIRVDVKSAAESWKKAVRDSEKRENKIGPCIAVRVPKEYVRNDALATRDGTIEYN